MYDRGEIQEDNVWCQECNRAHAALSVSEYIYVDSQDFRSALLDMGSSIAEWYGFDDKKENEQEEILADLQEWFSFSANRAEWNDGSWNFVEGETYINSFPVNF